MCDPDYPVLDAVIKRAKTDEVNLVMYAGAVIYEDSTFTRVDRAEALEKLRQDLALTDEEVERRGLSKALLPHVENAYDQYFDADAHKPFYRQSAMV